ncbi:16S rRNA (guanine(966)-N(2))-methyltransferase RsmD [Pseudokordiimonas caeni]|uniref:16S rRNA (guanine(966)-N(2))-methyltransferase RsmD n=1 Tax=Pseudokordiimonas caeni TaxID=2997908 RepID=UPI002810E5A9|nr:16S rRNA (guanine(966)-N(2))-methyltransferase RsmD [Pseudokordiimonas caeni]
MTRIIAGRFRGRTLEVPEGKDVRPTTDRMRERVFSMLQHSRYPDMLEARVLDLYAGTGALGLEALSRGAAHATFVEKAPVALGVLARNIRAVKADDMTAVIRGSATALPPASTPCDIIFMDPPYREGLVRPTLDAILKGGWLADKGVIVIEQATDDPMDLPDTLALIDERSQGQQRTLFVMHTRSD